MGTTADLAAPLRRGYSLRTRVALGVAAAIGFALFTAVLTALIDSPFLVRKIAPEWWVWPSLVATSVLGGALVPDRFCECHSGQQAQCVREGECSLRALWRTLDDTVRGVLRGVTLGDLAQNGRPTATATIEPPARSPA